MKVIDPGHVYKLDSIDGVCEQTITFVKREGEKWPGNVGHHPGTQTQELLRVIHDRLQYVNDQLPCAETQACLYMTETMLLLLEIRASRMHRRNLDLMHLGEVCFVIPCPVCGHLHCGEHAAEETIKAARENGL